jgi:hypothetical protein
MALSSTRRWLVLCGALSSACGGGGAIPVDEIAATTVDVECQVDVRCGYYPDVATCKSIVSPLAAQVADEVKAGRVIYDGAAARTCLDAIGALSCKKSDLFQQPSACDDAYKGTAAEGESCTTGEVCLSGTCLKVACAASVACCAGTCGAVRTVVDAGGDCKGSTKSCATGLFCGDDGQGGQVCQPRRALGAPCAAGLQCAAGLTCSRPATTGAMATCVPYPQEGQDCSATYGLCDAPDQHCDATTMKCARDVGVGAACLPGDDSCPPYARCDAATHACVAQRGLGGACAAQRDCLLELSCVSGACAARLTQNACP